MTSFDIHQHPTLRRQIQQVLAAAPTGITWTDVLLQVNHRRSANGTHTVTRRQLFRQMGLLLIEGEIDEHNGYWRANAAVADRHLPLPRIAA